MKIGELAKHRVDHEKIHLHLDQRLADIEQMLSTLLLQKNQLKQFKKTLQDPWAKGKCLSVQDVVDLRLLNTQT